MENDKLILGGHEFNSRFILGSGKYSLDLIKAAVENAGAEIITLALRRAVTGKVANILDYIPKNVTLLPNTSGARNADEAVRIARLSREAGCGDFIKIEVIRDSKYLLPDNYETVKATEILAKEGFVVLPYMYPDLNVARSLRDAGAAAIMPLGSPIGSNKGISTKEFIKIIINEIDLPVIVDAGIGKAEAVFHLLTGSAQDLVEDLRALLFRHRAELVVRLRGEREVAALAHQPVVFKDDLSAADIHRVLIAPDILDARAVALVGQRADKAADPVEIVGLGVERHIAQIVRHLRDICVHR